MAQVYVHRFYAVASLLDHGILKIAKGCLFLASKVAEEPRKIKHIVNVFHHLLDPKSEPIQLFSNEYYQQRQSVVTSETLILHAMSYQVSNVQLPHAMLVCYINQVLSIDNQDTKKQVSKQAWSYVNDSMRLNVCICYQPHTIACAALFMALKDFKVSMRTASIKWYEFLDVSLEEIQNVSGTLLEMYAAGSAYTVNKLPCTSSALKEHLKSMKSI